MNKKQLFEKVNKYLYDTKERTNITMEWVESNCEVIREEKDKIINHLKAKLKRTCYKPCMFCKTISKVSEQYDSYYCPKCLYWIERICPDRECDYCKGRPNYPVKGQK